MLTERLITVKNCINNSNITLDVGTDHGYVPISLINEGRARKVIAADINKGPLDNAEKNIRLNGLSDKIEIRLGGGITPVKVGEADSVIIAGMGGILISEILEESIEKSKLFSRLVLQPMNSQEDLRKYLFNNEFKIEKEFLAAEGEKIYNILLVTPGQDSPYLKECYYYLGKPEKFEKNELLNIYIKKRRKQFNDIINNLSSAKRDMSEEIAFYKEMLNDTEDFYD